MNATILRIFFTLAVLAFPLRALTQDGTRLLPASIAKTIDIQWKQDGRAIDLKMANPVGNWVVTSVLLKIHFQPAKMKIDGEFQRDKSGRMISVPLKPGVKFEEILVEDTPEQSKLKVEIQPGTVVDLFYELNSQSAVAGISILEARGREQTTFERLKSKVL